PGTDAQIADYMTNSLNQYTDITTTVNSDQQVTNVPVYDDDGNLTEVSDYPGSLKYSYNAENRLVAAAPELPMQDDTKVEFVYDYMGRRVKKTVSVWNGTWVQEAEKLFVYDGWNMICEITSENSQPATEKYYVWGLDLSQSLQGAGGIGGLIATLDNSASVVYYYLYDANGNVGQLVNATDGSIAAHYEYDPFGNTIKAEGEYKDSNPYCFSTKFSDSETGLIYFGFRFYYPTLGRWLNRDPIGEKGGLNLYAFVLNNPCNLLDLLGLDVSERFINWIKDGAYEKNGEWRRKHGSQESEQEALPFIRQFVTALYGAESEGINVDDLSDEELDNLYIDTRNYHREVYFDIVSSICLWGSFRGLLKSPAGNSIPPRRTWQEAGISPSNAQRIQNAATRTNQRIIVVGSRAKDTAQANSDWDYIMSGSSRQRHSARSSVPRGSSGGEINAANRETGIDVFQDYNPNAPGYKPLNLNEPHVIFDP
ncbi:MAG: RHS repeat-associated core domain-containing protein, partial [Desulfobacterales bacterium]|nr:RHS repeat-associated core domain-containing protein [Desulfobacterales bacterium]